MEMRETVLAWLRDAHAMEAAAIDNLERNIDRFDEYPSVQQKFREDLEQSKRHVEELDLILDKMGGDRSVLKDMSMKFAGMMQPYLGAMASDEVVKHLLAAHAYENFEVASYRSLAAAAEQIGEMQLKDMAERSLGQKKMMADWIDQQLPSVTREYLRKVQ
ncbi:MAG: DUF892 family protein [Alphaproteobacteria bacterium]|nr:DUF892 family protein [Alphaproteobacteria bacterium]MBF0374743.1 DUF892 family protein [Alphaproteobacteria bacterium]MBF0393506.1 DUF892 family protein [Alphaproteobacteria bacterium]